MLTKWFIDTLRHYPELSIFLTLGVGYFVGKLKFGGIALGAVTGTLLVGVLVGQLGIVISPNVKAVFFLMFLFAVGYGVGPQFFRGFKSGGLSQVLFAVILCVTCLLCAFLAAKICGFDVGSAAGLLSGACTISAVIGVATDTINQLGISSELKKTFTDHIPIAYAVTYIFGTAGSAWFLSFIGPKLLRVNLADECKKMEREMGEGQSEPGVISAYLNLSVRSYKVANPTVIGKTIAEFEEHFKLHRVFVDRLRDGDKIVDPDPALIIEKDDVLAIFSTREAILDMEREVGPEVDDRDLLDFPAEFLNIVIINKAIAGKTLKELSESEAGKKNSRGIFIRRLVRNGVELPVTIGTKIDRGDVVTIAGAKRDVERVVKLIGYAERPTEKTDMVFVGIGILIGGLIGALAIKVGEVPLSLSTSGGVLIMGLIFGWLRSVHPTFGLIPAPALWVMNNVGLTTFIAVVGISAGPGFVAGLREAGLMLFAAGIFVTLVPFIVGIYAGKYIFKMNAGIILGACAGARTTTAALGAIQDVAGSKVPALGYTITYAVGNTLLIIWGVVIVMLMG